MTKEAQHSPRRRALLKGAATVGALAAAGAPAIAAAKAAHTPADPWRRAADIQRRFAKPLSFPKRDYPITGFGAKPCELAKVQGYPTIRKKGELDTQAPGSHDSHPALRAAIEAAHKAGGGRVVIPAGNWYLKGPITLLSNVHVHLKAGAQVLFSTDPKDYARDGDYDCGKNGKLVLSRWQGNDCLNFSPLVYARGQKNIAITGEDWTSILNGQAGVPMEDGSGACWWSMNPKAALPGAVHQGVPNPANPASLAEVAPHLDDAARARIQGQGERWRSDERYLPALSEAGIPFEKRIFGLGHTLRPCMVEFVDCSDVLMQGYLVINTPFWIHHPVNSRNVHINKVRMDSIGPNSDGVDPESCDTVLVEGCEFNTGDDCIAIKSGKNRDTQYGPTRNMLVQNCVMNSGHGGLTLGSEMSAGIEHIYAQNIEFRNAHWASDPLWTAIRLKTNMNRGGYLRHLYVRDITLPNGVQTTPRPYKPLPGTLLGSAKVPSTGGGAVLTIDCDYAPSDDIVRIRPPEVSHVHIARVRASNVNGPDGAYSCNQIMVVLGPVPSSFNGAAGTPVLPLSDISITDADFGTPRNAEEPWFVYNVKRLKLSNVRIAGKTINTELNA
ncbi:endopolygalacturonase [Pseudoduganella sp. DS3]|uniref:Endopolygalacturonase n=1 Tax=Pseudoduganella guangdongensis TaxID=2692179 RepID=A0A6N9HEY7_9BURK|nr:glycoside hydrolase family 28 protein [Pseudoduganella guangdongensis]MYN02148.1 endopolygalacturonase [Pseudoduganella guangdongensis]